MTTFIGCSYYESDSEVLVCPNCDEKLVVAYSADLMDVYDEETETLYRTCPICCVQNKADLFLDLDNE